MGNIRRKPRYCSVEIVTRARIFTRGNSLKLGKEIRFGEMGKWHYKKLWNNFSIELWPNIQIFCDSKILLFNID